MVRNSGPAQVSAARLAAGGVCGHHQATVDQLFWSLGPGRITGADRVSRGSQRGRAVFCLEGERHESGPEESMTAIIIAREELEPEALMSALGGL
ncbi:MAG TPA: hypothetical protein VF171_04575 [Trueperaceae bacterium]